MNIHDIIANMSGQTELPAILFALRLGGPRRRSYCRPKFNYEIGYTEKKPPGFIGSHPVLFGVISFLLFCLLLIVAGK